MDEESPFDTASFFTKFTFSYVFPLINIGAKRPLTESDVPPVPKTHDAERNLSLLIGHWNDEIKSAAEANRVPQLVRATIRRHGYTWCLSLMYLMPNIAIWLLQPYFIGAILKYVSTDELVIFGDKMDPILAACIIGAITVITTGVAQLGYTAVNLANLKTRTAIVALIFSKCLRLSSTSKGKYTTGEIMTLMSVDMERIWHGIMFSQWSLIGPAIMIGCLVCVSYLVGVYSALTAAASSIFLLFLFLLLGDAISNARNALVVHTEHRMKLINESLLGIRVVKMYAWEDALVERIHQTREMELQALQYYLRLRLINTVMSFVGPTLIAFVVFLTYTRTGGELTVQKTYTIIAFLNVFRLPLAWLPFSWTYGQEALHSFERMSTFLNMEESEGQQQMALDNMIASSSKVGASASSAAVVAAVHDGQIELIESGSTIVPPVIAPTDVVVSMKNCRYCWDRSAYDMCSDAVKESSCAVKDASFTIHRGEFVAVIGSVGSGKSSLISAMLGQMSRVHGQQFTVASAQSNGIAYVSQDHWIQNMTVKKNILFGSVYDESLYRQVIQAAQLTLDLANLPHGDQTEIGERGINLSGGQKARVSIARALYANNAELFCFDDSLASVDVHVGKAIFEDAFRGTLKDKTRLVVLSSHYHFLPKFDKILLMNGGEVESFTSYDQLIDVHPQYTAAENDEEEDSVEVRDEVQSNLVLVDAVTATGSREISTESKSTVPLNLSATPCSEHEQEPSSSSGSVLVPLNQKKDEKSTGREIIISEGIAQGAVSSRTYLDFFSGATSHANGYMVGGAMMVLFAVTQLCRLAFDMWIGLWASDKSGVISMLRSSHTDSFYFNWFIILFAVFFVLCIVRAFLFIQMCIQCSRNLYNKLMHAIFAAPINTYFDVTPIGRILNRFTQDLDAVDTLLPDSFLMNLQNGFFLLSAFAMCIVVTPYFVIMLVPTITAVYMVQDYFRRSSRELKRLDRATRSPLFSHFGETIQGLSVIRAFGRSELVIKESIMRIRRNMKSCFYFWMTQRWLAMRIDMLAGVMFFAVTLSAVLVTKFGGNINPNYVGIALVYTLQLTGLMQWSIRASIETENGMTSVERLLEFSVITPEKPAVLPTDPLPAADVEALKEIAASDGEVNFTGRKRMDSKGLCVEVVSSDVVASTSADGSVATWPTVGSIQIRNLHMRYRPDLALTLRGVTVNIPGGCKVGVCGRTGAGKSSLMLALFRIVEPEEGSYIGIDGVDICTLGLHTLRSRLTIIPQDPVMFAGTLRYNLDPFSAYTDTAIWLALERVQLKDTIIERFPEKLEYLISERGENISVGQRQLLCIARALLRKSKVIVLDEATASVDNITDQKIQLAIRNEFRHCTVLTIAHRLETIADSDMIVVLDQGKVAEFGSPAQLLGHVECSADMDGSNSITGADQDCMVQGIFKDMMEKVVLSTTSSARNTPNPTAA